MLNFSSENSAINMALGYFDAQKVLYGLSGQDYYIDRTLTEDQAYQHLLHHVKSPDISLREFNEEILPAFGRKLGCTEGDYYELFLSMLERMAQVSGITPYRIRTDEELYQEVLTSTHRAPDKVLDLYLVS